MMQKVLWQESAQGTVTDGFQQRAAIGHVHTLWDGGGVQEKKTIPGKTTIGATAHSTNFSTSRFYENKPFFKLNLALYFCI